MSRSEAYLIVLNGPLKGGVFVLSGLKIFEIGRGDGCHVQLPDEAVGLNHGRISVQRGEWRFTNLNEERGSSVNDIKVDTRILDGYEVIRVGSSELQFTFDPPNQTKGTGEKKAGSATDIDLPSIDKLVDPPAPSASAPLYKLTVIDGNEADIGREIDFGESYTCVIGRSINSDFVLMDGKISRSHCSIEIRDGHLVVYDLGSSNGTVVNGERVQKTVLKHGDYLRLGFTVLGCQHLAQGVRTS